MTTLKDLALAGYRLEKQAGLIDGAKKVGQAVKDFAPRAERVIRTNKGAREGLALGGAVGGVAGYIAGKKSVEKQASLVDVAKTFASTAKGVGSVAKNLVKQNPTAAKAALGGAVAGAALSKATSGQTKQADEKKKPYGALRTVGDVGLTVLDSYAGKAIGGLVAAKLHKMPKGVVRPIRGRLDAAKALGYGQGVGATLGASMGISNAKARREEHRKYAAVIDKALAKEEKDDVGPFNASPGEAGKTGKSSLIAAAKAEMAKPA